MTAKVAIAAQLKPTLAVSPPYIRAFVEVPSAIDLARVYNNIDGDGRIEPVLIQGINGLLWSINQ